MKKALKNTTDTIIDLSPRKIYHEIVSIPEKIRENRLRRLEKKLLKLHIKYMKQVGIHNDFSDFMSMFKKESSQQTNEKN
jgi:hypothetical protein